VDKINFGFHIKVLQLIGTSKDRAYIGSLLTGQRLLWETLVNKAFQTKEFTAIGNVFLVISDYHQRFSRLKIPLLYLEEIRFFTHAVVERLIKEDVNEVTENVVFIYEQILRRHYLFSLPPEDQINDFKDHSMVERNRRTGWQIEAIDLQWQEIAHSIPYVFSIISSKSIEKKNMGIFRVVLSAYQQLLNDLQDAEIGPLSKSQLIKDHVRNFYSEQIAAIKSGLLVETIYVEQLNWFIPDMIDANSSYKTDVLESYSEFLLELYSLNKLDPYTINSLASLGRHCADKYLNNVGSKETMLYILKVIRHLKQLFEGQIPMNVESYNALRYAVNSFIEFHKKPDYKAGKAIPKQQQDEDLLQLLNDLLKEFKELETAKSISRVDWN